MKLDANDLLRSHGPDGLRQIIDSTPGMQFSTKADNAALPSSELEDPKPSELPTLSAADFDGRPVPERSWVVRDMIPDRTVTLLSGDGSVGKSLLSLQLAIAKATGGFWLGLPLDAGPVVFVSAEDDRDEIHRRLAAIAHAQGVGLASLRDLHLVLLAGLDAVLGAPDRKSGIIKETPVFRSLVEIVTKTKARLVILDTLADVFAGNEIARQEARQFIGILRGLAINHELAVLLLAHPSLTGMSSGTGTSGSTAWNNSVRSRLYFERIKDKDDSEADSNLRFLRVKKANYGPAGGELRLRWSDGCFISETPGYGFDKLAADAKAERIFTDLLAAMIGQGRDLSSKPSVTYAPTVFEAHPNSEGFTKKAFAGAMERLFSTGRIRVDTFGPQSRQRSRIVFSERRNEANS